MRPEWLWVVLFYPASGVVEEEEVISAHSAESIHVRVSVIVGESRLLEGRRKQRRRKRHSGIGDQK